MYIFQYNYKNVHFVHKVLYVHYIHLVHYKHYIHYVRNVHLHNKLFMPYIIRKNNIAK